MKWFENLFKRSDVSEDEKIYKRHQNWIFWLTGGWLLATFQHNYATLSKYNLGETLDLGWLFANLLLPIADISNFVMVLVLELTLFFSIYFISTGKRWGIKTTVIYMAMIVSTVISIFLNVKYMVAASPSDSIVDISIGAVIGVLIPVMVVIFGYIEGNVVESRMAAPTIRGGLVTDDMVRAALKENPRLTQRQAAERFGISLGKMNSIYRRIESTRGERLNGKN
ncbi:MAG: winged helix-turn-helix transcriptional regulator [Candidatus Heimdallarchaeaceae archaeon]|jgi:hypothetical protein